MRGSHTGRAAGDWLPPARLCKRLHPALMAVNDWLAWVHSVRGRGGEGDHLSGAGGTLPPLWGRPGRETRLDEAASRGLREPWMAKQAGRRVGRRPAFGGT